MYTSSTSKGQIYLDFSVSLSQEIYIQYVFEKYTKIRLDI